jgi:outer membrane receptor protein involved in Fe transport
MGTIFDAANGQPLRGVKVEANGQSTNDMVTDTDGKFRLSLPVGKYKLRFTVDTHLETTVDDVEVKAGEIVEASTVMPAKGSVTTVEVNEKVGAIQATSEAVLSERKLATTVQDSISADDIKNSTASDAAGALEKVTGVSVVDGGFVYVRGLGERYSSTMLNNAMIPTTEPERRVVPLDLFPAALIDNIKVQKTYSPELPGEFSGGLVNMTTTEFPTTKTLRVSVSYGFNTLTSFNRFGSFRGGQSDFFGFPSSNYSLPSIIPEQPLLFVGNYSEQQFQQFGRAFLPDYEVAPVESMRPQQTYSVAGGTSVGKWGFVGALTFTNNPGRVPQLQRFLVDSGGGTPQIFSDYNFDLDTETARWGGVFNAAYKLNAATKFVFRNTLTKDSDKEARVIRGLNGSNGQEIEATRLRWTDRMLASTGVEGEHSVAKLWNSIFRWQFTLSDSSRNEPDLRETIRGREPGSTGAYGYINVPESGVRFFNNLSDRIYEPQAEWGIPFYKGKFAGIFKTGFRGTVRRRDFSGRRFRYFPVRAGTIDFSQSTNTVLGLPNIRPDGFAVREITRGTDTYDAEMDIYGGFAMVDLSLGSRWRVVAGARVEDANIVVSTINPLVPGGIPSVARLNNRDLLPSVNLIYALTPRQNLRVGWGRTVNRPDFRELSPFEFNNVVGGYSTTGNPNLQRARIDNLDARWEWFLGGNQVLAVSYFWKDFTSPIEQVYLPTASELRQSFLNVDGARNQGVELEFRKNMGFLSKRARDFAVQTNFTFVDSNVRIPTDQFVILTSSNRPLVGQSRYIYNVIAEWVKPQLHSQARFYVNSVSRRITDVGTFKLPDVYQERNTFLDFVYQYDILENGKWSFRFSAENLTDNEYRYTQADFLVRQFKIGRTFSIGTSFSFY